MLNFMLGITLFLPVIAFFIAASTYWAFKDEIHKSLKEWYAEKICSK